MKKKTLEQLCEEHKASIEGIKFLLSYYQNSLKWSYKESVSYIQKLFEMAQFDEILIIGGKNNDNKKNRRS